VNDVTDSHDLPDAIYFTDATQDIVNILENATVTKISDTEYRLVMMPTDAGWSYGSVLDPTVGKQKLTKIVRQSDGQELPLDNVWQTGWTIPDGQEPIKDARLHFVANMALTGETFALTFAPKPSYELEVEKIEGQPKEGILQTEPLRTLTVTFNKPIKAETFTSEDITLACQGVQLNTSLINITKQSDTEFTLDISAISGADGYYVLTIQTATITDSEGFEGSVGKQATWVQFAGGKVNLVVKAQPAEAGTVTPASGAFDYNQPVTLTAMANDGYDFQKWTEGTQTVSEQATFSYTPQGSTELTAVFTPKYFDVTITTGDVAGGTIEGGGTGRYAYGTQLTLTATAQPGYVFETWMLDGEKQKTTDATFQWTVTKAATITAVFSELPYAVLTGRVTNADDDLPIKGAVVTLTSAPLSSEVLPVTYTAVTDQFGRYTMQVEDKTLTYDVSCQAEGFIWSPNAQLWFDNGQQTKNFSLLPGATVILPEGGICTFSPVVDVEVGSQKVDVWYVSSLDPQAFVLTKLTSGTIKAGEGVVLVGTDDAERIDMRQTPTATAISGNFLIGTGANAYTVVTDNVYVLKETAETPEQTRFMQAARGLVIPAGKAYCQYTVGSGQPGEVDVIWSDPDLIEAVKAAFNDPDAPHYDLQGRRIYKVDAPNKLHVVKGQKVIVK
jgi:hypothetical protein